MNKVKYLFAPLIRKQTDLYSEHHKNDSSGTPRPSWTADPNLRNFRQSAGKGRFFKLFKNALKTSSRIQPEERSPVMRERIGKFSFKKVPPHRSGSLLSTFPAKRRADPNSPKTETGWKEKTGGEQENKVPNPSDAPIRLKNYPGYGPQTQAKVACTDYARQAAELLVVDGKLDTRHAARMMKDVGEMRDLPEHYRKHVVRTLKLLTEDAELAATINGTCANGPPKGPAAESVSATLNLDFGEEVTEAHARKAVVMALLGNLRQGAAGECFAIAPAICLHAESPGVVARHLKEMLELNYLSFEYEGITSQVPFNRRFSNVSAQTPLSVTVSGVCRGTACSLHDIPGMQAALKVLGVPPADRLYAVYDALGRIGVQHDGYTQVTCQQVIEEIARSRPDNPDQQKLVSAALRAFEAQDTVGLLRSWTHTLAAKGAAHNVRTQAGTMIDRLLFSESNTGTEQSLSKVEMKTRGRLLSQERFRDIPLRDISAQLFEEIQLQMERRFVRLYDPDAERETVSSDGVSQRGGWVLYDRTPADDPTQWEPVDTAGKFQDTMVDMINKAHAAMEGARIGLLASEGRDPRPLANQDALSIVADDLIAHVRGKAFIEYAESQFTNGKTDAANSDEILWQGVCGGSTVRVAEHCGGDIIHTGKRPDVEDEYDATEIIKILGKGFSKMSAELRERSKSDPGFRTLVGNEVHAFNLFPEKMKDVWLHDATPLEWIDKTLKKPVMDIVNEERHKPSLWGVLQRIGGEIDLDHRQQMRIYHRMAAKFNSTKTLMQSYTVAALYKALLEQCKGDEDEEDKIRQVQELLRQEFNFPPPCNIADTGWSDRDGNIVCFGFVYNPFEDRVEFYRTHNDSLVGRARGRMWLDGTWIMHKPFPTR